MVSGIAARTSKCKTPSIEPLVKITKNKDGKYSVAYTDADPDGDDIVGFVAAIKPVTWKISASRLARAAMTSAGKVKVEIFILTLLFF
jgi:hypothetical protein